MCLIFVVMGIDSECVCKVENKKLFKYGFRFFEIFMFYNVGYSFVVYWIYMGDREIVDFGIN